MSEATIHQLAAYRRPGDPFAEVAGLELLAQRAGAVLAAAETAISGSRRGRPGLQALSAEFAVLWAALAAVAQRQITVSAVNALGFAQGQQARPVLRTAGGEDGGAS
jgi:hypothetical protein